MENFAAVKRCSEFEQFGREIKKPWSPFYTRFNISAAVPNPEVLPEKAGNSGDYSQPKRRTRVASVEQQQHHNEHKIEHRPITL